MKRMVIFFIMFLAFRMVDAQSVDTSTKALPTDQFRKIINGTYSDTLSTHIYIFGNTDCHRCEELHKLFIEYNLPWIEYDMHIPEHINIAYELVRFAENSEHLSFSFPVVVVNKKIYYNIPDFKVFAEKIKAEFKP